MEVRLPFRKTSQFGGVCENFITTWLSLQTLSFVDPFKSDIKPFVLHSLPQEMKHLCPVRAYVDWINATSIQDGYIFRKMASGDRVSMNNEPMVWVFLNRNNLLPFFWLSICHFL
jgi:hypothetical protein